MVYDRFAREDTDSLVKRWGPFLEGIDSEYTAENTAILLENEARYLAEAPSTSVSDVQGLQKIMLPIVRRVFPNLISNNLVSVQPIAGPAGIIFYLKYVFGTEAPGTSQYSEYSMFENVAGSGEGYNPFYSLDEKGPFSVTPATDVDAVVDCTGFAAKWPAVANSYFGTIEDAEGVYHFAYEGGGYVVRPADRLQTSGKYTVTVAAGSVTVSKATASTMAGVIVKAWYKTDMEFSKEIPEMKISISSIPVTVKNRKLKAMWSQESEQDLKAFHGLSADAELTSLVSNEMIAEIDREIIQKCMSIVPNNMRGSYTWNQFESNNTSGNFLDAHLAMMQKVTRQSNEIFRQSKIGPANWLVMGTKVASYVEVLKGFIPNPVTESMGMNIVKAGNYAGRFDIYKDPMFPEDLVLMGHKSPASPFGAGVVYSPYVTNLTPVIVGQDDFNPRRGFLARYGLTQVPHGQLLYGLLKINALP
jgi:hypothetical protein